jgi:hypothetical protein
MKLFIVTATYYEPGDGQVMGTSVDGVFSTLELAQECEASIKASQEYSDFDITTAINIMQLDDTLYKEIV